MTGEEKEIISWLIHMADGNMGALSFAMDCLSRNDIDSVLALKRMDVLNIRGEKLYILWNDCCNRDMDKTIHVMNMKSEDELHDHTDLEKNKGRGKPFV